MSRNDKAEIRVLRSTGVDDVIPLSLNSTSVRELKLAVSKSDRLGRIPTTQQRVFHLGKELITPGDMLGDLLMIQTSGVVHVHATPAKEIVEIDDSDDDDDDCVLVEAPMPAPKRRRVR